MGRKSRSWSRGLSRAGNLFDEIREHRVGSRFGHLRSRLYRSPDGLVLGVFRGMAESLGYRVCRTRIIGCFALLFLSSLVDAHGVATLCVAGFFYVLAALLMQPPRQFAMADAAGGDAGHSSPPPPSRPRPAGPARAVPYQQVRPRVDFHALDRQLDQISRRIQRMETIVTDRQYDWERRMEEK